MHCKNHQINVILLKMIVVLYIRLYYLISFSDLVSTNWPWYWKLSVSVTLYTLWCIWTNQQIKHRVITLLWGVLVTMMTEKILMLGKQVIYYVYRITAVMKVVTFKTYVIVFIGYIIMCTMSHWPIIFREESDYSVLYLLICPYQVVAEEDSCS
jgi:hypothetical protein